MHTLSLTLVERRIRVHCADRLSHALVETAYGGIGGAGDAVDLQYSLTYRDRPPTFVLATRAPAPIVAQTDGELLAVFEDQLALDLQRQRPDLYFLHAAVLACGGKAFMLLAPSGGGKSTTAWALVREGCQYLSDELGPVDLTTLRVHPYPRALCLKTAPPASYPLPAQTLATTLTLHVPTAALPAPPGTRPLPLVALFFLDYRPTLAPRLHPLGAAEASARLFAQALNPLAHPAHGLDGAIAIVRNTACFRLVSGDLFATCMQVRRALARVA